MSAPNSSFDPVQVASLQADQLEAQRQAAEAAIAAAPDLGVLHTVKVAHLGDRAPLRLARAEIGAVVSRLIDATTTPG